VLDRGREMREREREREGEREEAKEDVQIKIWNLKVVKKY